MPKSLSRRVECNSNNIADLQRAFEQLTWVVARYRHSGSSKLIAYLVWLLCKYMKKTQTQRVDWGVKKTLYSTMWCFFYTLFSRVEKKIFQQLKLSS